MVLYKGYTIPELSNNDERLFDTNDIEVMGPPVIFYHLLVLRKSDGDRIITDIDLTELQKLKDQANDENDIIKINQHYIIDRCKMLIDKKEGN